MNIIELKHPLIKHKVSLLRDIHTGTKEFREIVSEISVLLCYEALKEAELKTKEITTPTSKCDGTYINEDNYVFLPILRAGMSMVEGIINAVPNAKIGHIGLYRNEETLKPVRYYYKVPKNIEQKEVIILDPMFATGGSALATIELLKADGVKNIKFLSIFAAPEGIKLINEKHPGVKLYTASIDKCLNDVGYIIPGCGDAGDRVYGTK